MSTNLKLNVHSVKCIDETGGKWREKIGNDEIYMAAFTMTDNLELVRKNAFSVYGDFDDGDQFNFNPPKVLLNMNIASAENGSTYGAGIILAEKDNNRSWDSLWDFLYHYSSSNPKAKDLPVALRVGTQLLHKGTLALKKFDEFIGSEFSRAYEDDFFPPMQVYTTLSGKDHTWNGQLTSPVFSAECTAHDGKYRVYYSWELL